MCPGPPELGLFDFDFQVCLSGGRFAPAMLDLAARRIAQFPFKHRIGALCSALYKERCTFEIVRDSRTYPYVVYPRSSGHVEPNVGEDTHLDRVGPGAEIRTEIAVAFSQVFVARHILMLWERFDLAEILQGRRKNNQQYVVAAGRGKPVCNVDDITAIHIIKRADKPAV